ncbi:hypothetical protein AMTRI_Chr12g274920 [Amborella trichopoda]
MCIFLKLLVLVVLRSSNSKKALILARRVCGLATLFSSAMTFPSVREEFSQFTNILVIAHCLEKPKSNSKAHIGNSSVLMGDRKKKLLERILKLRESSWRNHGRGKMGVDIFE